MPELLLVAGRAHRAAAAGVVGADVGGLPGRGGGTGRTDPGNWRPLAALERGVSRRGPHGAAVLRGRDGGPSRGPGPDLGLDSSRRPQSRGWRRANHHAEGGESPMTHVVISNNPLAG